MAGRQIAGGRATAAIKRATIGPRHHAAIGVAGRQHDVAAPFGKFATPDGADIASQPVGLLGNAGLTRYFKPLEPVSQAEIDHARYRIGAIDRRAAASGDLDPVERDGGNGVDIHHPAWAGHRQAAAIQQHEVALLAQPAQVSRGITAPSQRVGGGIGAGAEQRELRQRLLEIDLEICAKLVRAGGDNGGGCGLVWQGDARAGDHNFLRPGLVGDQGVGDQGARHQSCKPQRMRQRMQGRRPIFPVRPLIAHTP